MKCPLLTIASVWATPEQKIKALDCLKEECAWWDEHGGFCSVLKIGRHLEGILKALEDLVDKMPHEVQFRR